MSELRSHAFGVVSDHTFESFLLQRIRKKAEKEKSMDKDLVDSKRLMKKLRKHRSTEGVREPEVYDSVHGLAFYSSNVRSPNVYCDDPRNT